MAVTIKTAFWSTNSYIIHVWQLGFVFQNFPNSCNNFCLSLSIFLFCLFSFSFSFIIIEGITVFSVTVTLQSPNDAIGKQRKQGTLFSFLAETHLSFRVETHLLLPQNLNFYLGFASFVLKHSKPVAFYLVIFFLVAIFILCRSMSLRVGLFAC